MNAKVTKAKITKDIHNKKKKKKTGSSAPSKDTISQMIIDINFWRQIDHNNYFRKPNQLAFEINKTVNLLSKHNPIDDLVYSKTSFPSSLKNYLGKGIDALIRSNNPMLITKFLGLYIYMENNRFINKDEDEDNLNESKGNTAKIKEEINFLEEKAEEIEQNNLNNIMRLIDLANRIDNATEIININNDKSKLQRYNNLIIQITELQIKQFAESICGVKREIKTNKYIVTFDPSENIDPLTLTHEDYTKLIRYRDQFNSISFYDLLQEKIFSYYISNTKGTETKLKLKKNDIQIGKKLKTQYNYCHNCKQRKPVEVMLQCKNHLSNIKYTPRPNKTYYINRTTVVRRNKSLVIKHFEGDPKEYIENIEYYDEVKECRKYFCHFCLKGSYDIVFDTVKQKKDWVCPYCTGVCFCSRCTRNDKLLKLIGLYVSLDGDLSVLYDTMVTESVVLDKLNANMVLSNLVVLINDPVSNPKEAVDNLLKIQVKDIDTIDKAVAKCDSYTSNLSKLQFYFEQVFTQARKDKGLLYYDKVASSSFCIDEDELESSSSSFLSKKTNRSKEMNKNGSCNTNSNNITNIEALMKKESNPSPLIRILEPKILETFKLYLRKRGRPRKNPE